LVKRCFALNQARFSPSNAVGRVRIPATNKAFEPFVGHLLAVKILAKRRFRIGLQQVAANWSSSAAA
jgi:hypothetical protein